VKNEFTEKSAEQFPSADKHFAVKEVDSFRCCFGQQLKRVLDSQKSGTSADDIYVPNL
jgi:hypothetical protein